jgi:hypothetical protein
LDPVPGLVVRSVCFNVAATWISFIYSVYSTFLLSQYYVILALPNLHLGTYKLGNLFSKA